MYIHTYGLQGQLVGQLERLAQRQDDLVAQVHVHRAEDVATVVAGLQVLSDAGEGTQVLRVPGRTGNVPDLVLRSDVLVGGVDELDPFVRDGQDDGGDLLHVLRGFPHLGTGVLCGFCPSQIFDRHGAQILGFTTAGLEDELLWLVLAALHTGVGAARLGGQRVSLASRAPPGF